MTGGGIAGGLNHAIRRRLRAGWVSASDPIPLEPGYTKTISQTRDEALAALREQAAALGAKAVVAMRFDSGEVDAGQGSAMNEVTAYDTAALIEVWEPPLTSRK